MLHKGLASLLLLCALFSGQLLAATDGHLSYRIHDPDHQLRHDADSDDLRGRSKEAADELSENHHAVQFRRPPLTLR